MRSARTTAALVALVTTTAALTLVPGSARAAEVDVTGVQFRWGFNQESNNRGVVGFNLFSAGRLANPGSSKTLDNNTAGATWTGGAAAGWTAHQGNVYIEKKQADDSYALATWAGTKTDKNGQSLGSYAATDKPFSDHQVVIDNGAGTLDAEGDDAEISWDGDFTVVYYSGYTFFSVSDPHLSVVDGVGTVRATLGGYGASMEDPSVWEPLTDTEVTLATLPSVDVTAEGLTTLPAYRGIAYDAPSGATPQSVGTDDWGSFPQSFADFQQSTGQSSYWYSSGGPTDGNKPALPITVDTTPEPRVVVEEPKTASTLSLTVPGTAYGRGSRVTAAVTPATATGTITLTGAGSPLTARLAAGRATFTLPASLRPGRYALSASYAGDDRLLAGSGAATLAVAKAGVAKPRLKVTAKPTRRQRGKVLVTVASATPAAATGRVTLRLVSGRARKSVAGTLTGGRATVRLPKLAAGRWKVTVAYAGSATHASSAKAYAVRVR